VEKEKRAVGETNGKDEFFGAVDFTYFSGLKIQLLQK
jgi:hypothetical protein